MTFYNTLLKRPKEAPPTLKSSKANQSALQTPEILELIFSFLSQTRLRSTVVLVSRQWNTVAKGLLTQTLHWDVQLHSKVDDQEPTLLTKLAYVDVVDCYQSALSPPSAQEIDGGWRILLAAMKKSFEKQEFFIREVRVRSMTDPRAQLVPILGMLTRLTSLTLENLQPGVIYLDEILVLCPSLTSLALDSAWCWFMNRGSMRVLNKEPADFTLHESNLTPLKLKTLDLGFVGMKTAVLESLLKACDELQELRLGRVQHRRNFGGSTSLPGNHSNTRGFVPLDWLALFEKMGSLCPKLTRFHFAKPNEPFWTRPRMEALLEWFPLLDEVGFCGESQEPALLKSVQQHMDTLTTLAIGCQNQAERSSVKTTPFGTALHEYLCHAPLLEHLCAYETILPFELLDLKRIEPRWIGNNPSPQGPYQIWACRNLKTLHLAFAGRVGDGGSEVSSRQVFGYISRVCPKLEDVSVRKGNMSLHIQGGFCLLSRLKYLRKLRIQTGYFHDRWILDQDMSWIQRSGTSLTAMEWIAQQRWYHELKKPEKVYQGSDYFDKQEACRGLVVDGVDMSDVGWVKGVIQVLKDQKEKSWTCWPELESFEMVFKESPPDDSEGSAPGPGLKSLWAKYRPEVKVMKTVVKVLEYPGFRLY